MASIWVPRMNGTLPAKNGNVSAIRTAGRRSAVLAAQPGGGNLGSDVVDPHRRTGLRAGEVLQLAGGPANREHVGSEMPHVAVTAHRRLMPAGDVGRPAAEEPVEAL